MFFKKEILRKMHRHFQEVGWWTIITHLEIAKMHNVWPGIWSTESSACFQVANTHVWYWGYSLGCMVRILQNPDQIWYKRWNFGHFPCSTLFFWRAQLPNTAKPTKALSSFVVEGDFDFQRLYEVTKVVTHNLNKAGQVGGLESLLLSYKGCVWGYGTFGRKVGVGSGILVYIYIYI